MAFTDAQKRDIRKYMGCSFGFYDLNHRLESMLNLVGDNATDSAEIVEWLTELDAIDAALATAGTSTSATGMLKKVDEVEFYDGQQSAGFIAPGSVQRGTMLIERLARALGVWDYLPIGNYFGSRRNISTPFQLG